MGGEGLRRSRILLLTIVALLCAGCSNALLFFPSSTLVRTPADLELDYRDVFLESADGTRLHAWWLPAQGKSRATVYFLHGNAENISTHIASVWWLPAEGIDVLLLDYRGFGRSEGRPTLSGVVEDVAAGLDWLAAELPAEQPLVVLGQSLGASVAGYVTATRREQYPQLTAVVLDSAFTGFRDIAWDIATGHWLTWPFSPLVAWSMPARYELGEVIDRLAPLPVLIVHGEADTIIPVKHARRLYRMAGQPRQLLLHPGGHIATFGAPENREKLLAFIEEALQ
jgi:uncharacterized protein